MVVVSAQMPSSIVCLCLFDLCKETAWSHSQPAFLLTPLNTLSACGISNNLDLTMSRCCISLPSKNHVNLHFESLAVGLCLEYRCQQALSVTTHCPECASRSDLEGNLLFTAWLYGTTQQVGTVVPRGVEIRLGTWAVVE